MALGVVSPKKRNNSLHLFTILLILPMRSPLVKGIGLQGDPLERDRGIKGTWGQGDNGTMGRS